MLSSRLARDATSLLISPATRKALLHFLWINLHTVGEEERPGHRGTGTEMRRKHTHTCTYTHTHSHRNSFPQEQHTQPWLQYELPWSEPDESSESTQWIETTWNLYFNYSFTVQKVWRSSASHDWPCIRAWRINHLVLITRRSVEYFVIHIFSIQSKVDRAADN